MESQQRPSQLPWIALVALSLAAGALGFYLSYQDEQTRFLEMNSVVESHFIYALQLKDDMALIDWSKRLEKLPSVLAFQAHNGSKMIAEGGNQALCPMISHDGLSFYFPYRWIIHSTFQEVGTSTDITLVFQDLHGPFLWALCLFFASFLSGVTLFRLKPLSKTTPAPESQEIPEIKKPEVTKKIVSEVNDKSLTLALDADYIICQATPSAAKKLNRTVSELVGNHFLDLLPDPLLMKMIAEARENKFSTPLPSHPQLSVWVRPLPDGTLLIFEVKDAIQRL